MKIETSKMNAIVQKTNTIVWKINTIKNAYV